MIKSKKYILVKVVQLIFSEVIANTITILKKKITAVTIAITITLK